MADQAQLATLLVEQGQCDIRVVERGRRVAEETGQRLDRVLIQLGLLTERGLAQAYAALTGARLARPERYEGLQPILPELLPTRFLREAR